MNRKKVAVGISGGVDSAVSALLLKKAGYDVTGVHLYCWPPKSEIEKDGMTREEWIQKNGCRADEDRSSALKTCLELEIPFKVLDFSEEYNQRVIKYFYDEYEAGRTPNPDVLCNSEIKFGLFLSWAMENGFDYIATGHYAKLVGSKLTKDVLDLRPQSTGADPLRATFAGASAPGLVSLFIPKDKHKDQTYFLWKLTQKELSRVLFPLGDLEKSEVRKVASKAKLSVAERKDSQGICFVGNVEVREFLARRLAVKRGRVLDTKGNVAGEHDGVWFYTIGQRGGWKLNPDAQKKVSRQHSATVSQEYETPIYYVISKDAKKNELVVGEADEATGDRFEVGEVNWIGGGRLPRFGIPKLAMTGLDDLLVRIRHGGELLKAKIESDGGRLPHPARGGVRNDEVVSVVLENRVRGIAPGQSAVFYSHEGECLGGGVIC